MQTGATYCFNYHDRHQDRVQQWRLERPFGRSHALRSEHGHRRSAHAATEEGESDSQVSSVDANAQRDEPSFVQRQTTSTIDTDGHFILSGQHFSREQFIRSLQRSDHFNKQSLQQTKVRIPICGDPMTIVLFVQNDVYKTVTHIGSADQETSR